MCTIFYNIHPCIDVDIHTFSFEGLRDRYGDVVTLHLPRGIKWAVLNSAQAIHEGFVVNAEFLSEFHHSIVGVILEGKFVLLQFLFVLYPNYILRFSISSKG